MKKIKSLMFVAMLMCVFFMVSTSSAEAAEAATSNPYGYTFEDAASGKTIYRYYEFNLSKGAYVPAREFYSRGFSVCRSNGVVITNLSIGSGARYNGFDAEGNFYVITNNGELIRIEKNNTVSTVIESGAMSLVYDPDDLANAVRTTSGSMYLSNFEDAPEVEEENPNLPEVQKSPNRIEIYTNSAGEMVYDAYQSNKKIISIVTNATGNKILNATKGIRLSDTVKGAKFMGFDSSYNVYLYELNGTLYRFTKGNYYSAEKISLGSAFRSFKTDDNGFISKVITNKGTYTIKQLTTSGKWKAKKTYVVNKGTYVTLYTKGTTKSNTLLLNKGVLTLNGVSVATSVKKFGFINAKKFAYITKNGKAYTASISKSSKAKVVAKKAKSFKANKLGLLTQVVIKGAKNKKLA